jgi:hypothetical protein
MGSYDGHAARAAGWRRGELCLQELEKVLEKLATTDKATIVVARGPMAKCK